MNGGSPAVRRGNRKLRARQGKGASNNVQAEEAALSSFLEASCFVVSVPRHLQGESLAVLSSMAQARGATREACFVLLLFRSLLLVGVRRKVDAGLVRECEELVGKRVVSGREGEWRAFRRRRDRSLDVRVVGVTGQQITLTALRACVQEAVGAAGEWLERGLEETRAGAFFVQCESAVQREHACETLARLFPMGYTVYAVPVNSSAGATNTKPLRAAVAALPAGAPGPLGSVSAASGAVAGAAEASRTGPSDDTQLKMKILSLEVQMGDLAAQLSRACGLLERQSPAMVTGASQSAEPRGLVPRALFEEEGEESSRRELDEEPRSLQYGQEEGWEQDWSSDGEDVKKRTKEKEATNLSPVRKASRSGGTLDGFFNRGRIGTGRDGAESRGVK